MKRNYYLRTLILCYFLCLSFFGHSQNPSISVSTTNCTSWNCTPCDGSFTLTLNNPTGPGPYTFWLMDTTAWTIVDSITTFSTTHTFTGLCPGYYWTDIAWQNVGGNPCSNCTGGSSPCPTCPPTGSGGGGGGAGGAVGAPDPLLNFTWNAVQGDPCGWTSGSVDVTVNGQAPPFQVDFNMGFPTFSTISMSTTSTAYVNIGCDEEVASITVTDATGQSISQTVGFWYSCGYNAILNPIPAIEVCAGETIDPGDLNGYLQSGWYMATSAHFMWTNSNTLTGIPSNGQTSGAFSYTAANVTSTETSYIDITPFDPWGWGFCYANTQTLTVIVHPIPNVDAGPDLTVCEGQPVTLNGTGDGTLTWSNGIPNNSSFVPLTSLDLILSAVTTAGCTNEDTMSIVVNPSPIIDAGPDIFECEGAAITLNSPYPNSTWSGPASGGIVPGGYTDLILTVDWGNGCTSSDTVVVFGEGQPVAYITPDLTVCEGDTVVLTSAMSVNGNSFGSLPITSTMPFTPVSDIPFVPPVGVWYNSVTANIQWCTDGDMMTLTVLPAPTLDAGQDVTICLGDSVQLSATGTGIITWDTGTTNGDWYTPSTSGMAVASIIDGNGCEKMDTILITVNPLPTIDAGVQQTICVGDSIVLNGSGGTSYVWDNGVLDGVLFDPGTSGWYTVTGTDANGCTNQDSVEVVVNSLPVIDAGLDTTVCLNDSITLSGSGGVTYSWSNGIIDNVAFAVGGANTYVVTGTDVNGCQSTDYVSVNVFPLPAVDAGPDITICNGDSVQLIASGAITYNWNNGMQNGDFVLPPTNTTYIVEGTDANGCTDVDSVTVSISTPPNIDAGSNAYGCEGDLITLNATGSAGTITWAGNSNPYSVQVTSDTMFYYATIVDSAGCTAVDSLWVIGDSIPQVVFSAFPTEGCAPLNVQFVNLTNGNINDCSWDFGNGITASGCGNQSVTYTESGYYDVSLSVSTLGGCSNSATYANYIYVEPDPIANFVVSPEVVSELDGNVQAINLSSGATTYQWDFGDNSNLQFSLNGDHTYPIGVAQGYTIELVVYSPLMCTDTAWASVLVEEEVIFYVPNSFSPDGDAHNNTFYPVITSGIDVFDFEFIVFNRWGEQVFITNDPDYGWDGTYLGNMSQDGTYNWRMEFKLKNGDERQVHYGHVNLLK